jgi:hypothetical protein
MGDKHKAKAGRIIRQEQEKRIKQLEDKLAWENANRKGDRNVIVEKVNELAIKLIEDLSNECKNEQLRIPDLRRVPITNGDSTIYKIPMKSRVYSATTFWIVCRRLGINSLWCYIQEFAPECGGIVEWMFDSKNINHEIERHWSDRKSNANN